MALKSGTLHVTKTRAPIIAPPLAGGWVHLYNYNEEIDRPAYVGGETVVPGTGIPIFSGSPADKRPYWIFIEPNAQLYAVSDDGKDCWIGWLLTP
jgi:hypothetical protein